MTRQPARRTPGLPTRLLNDERLATDVASGSELAFTTLFDRYHQPLYRYCRSLTRSEQDAQDALQSAFMKALVALREGRRNAPIRPWLFRIAHNESISFLRSRGTSVELPAELESVDELITRVEDRDRLATLVRDLHELPERQRGALVMRELSGLSHAEISEALQISVGAAKQTILEARRSLLEFAEGRAMGCEEIQRILSDDDRRSLRSRRVRAHLRACGRCEAFEQAIPRRRAEMLALWPAMPAAGAAGLLGKLTGAGSGHGGSGAGLAASTAVKGLGATISAKAAVAAGAAVVATATVGAVAILHRPARGRSASAPRPAVLVPHKAAVLHLHSATALLSPTPARAVRQPVKRRSRGTAIAHPEPRHAANPSARRDVAQSAKSSAAPAQPASRSASAATPHGAHVGQRPPGPVVKARPVRRNTAGSVASPVHRSRPRNPVPAKARANARASERPLRGRPRTSPNSHASAAPASPAATTSTVAAPPTSAGNPAAASNGAASSNASGGGSGNKSAGRS